MELRYHIWESCSADALLIANIGDPFGILLLLAVLILSTLTMTKVTNKLKDNDGQSGLKMTTEMYFIVILKAILKEECTEKQWLKFEQNSLNLKQAGKFEMILKKSLFSDLKRQGFYGYVIRQ